ncbi:hypothetical protein [Hansschlegelia beijingensis]|uniref:Uncharacterized protein n=1 Tax=Hansschlegelia beijingensis TaxID=1133344 RepID=A0A7W6CVG1_9HYPH|nr:hypothetical protein [Hansschlegelia beijingensis]MBB3971860.1 hypothetical protein [Hansschlegelia beijingensis]
MSWRRAFDQQMARELEERRAFLSKPTTERWRLRTVRFALIVVPSAGLAAIFLWSDMPNCAAASALFGLFALVFHRVRGDVPASKEIGSDRARQN